MFRSLGTGRYEDLIGRRDGGILLRHSNVDRLQARLLFWSSLERQHILMLHLGHDLLQEGLEGHGGAKTNGVHLAPRFVRQLRKEVLAPG